MTLTEAKELLNTHNIPFEQNTYATEKEYWYHVSLFPYTANAKPCKVTALVIRSKNGIKHIELQFNDTLNGWQFEELRFGGYSFEMFDTLEEFLPSELMTNISSIMQNTLSFIECFDLKKKKWCGDAVFDLTDEDEVFGKQGFKKAVQKIKMEKRGFSKLVNSQKQYEIFDWTSITTIIK